MSGVGEWNEVEVRDSFGRVVGVEGSFTVDIPLEVAVNGGTIEAPDGSIITVTPDPEDGLHVTAQEGSAMTDAPNYLDTIPPDDQEQIKQALRDWQAEGQENPMIPLDGDVDGDGIADAFALDSFGNLVIVPAVPLVDTVSLSTGEGVETIGEEQADG